MDLIKMEDDLFEPAQVDEVRKRQEDKIKNCKHSWKDWEERIHHISHSFVVLDRMERCENCNSERNIVRWTDRNGKVMEEQIRLMYGIKPWRTVINNYGSV